MKMTGSAIVKRFFQWCGAIRPRTLVIATSPVCIGIACTHALGFPIHWIIAVMTLVSALCIQIGTNLANDYFDNRRGADTVDRLGPPRIGSGLGLSESSVRIGMIIAFCLAAISGIGVMVAGGWPLVIIGIMSIALGIGYTAGPFPLAYLGIADGVSFIFFGPISVAGTVYAQGQVWPLWTWILGMAVGCISVAILTINNIRDRHSDAAVGKRTIVVRLGGAYGKIQYSVMGIASLVIPMGVGWVKSSPVWMLPAVGSISLIGLIFNIYRLDGRELNALMGKTALFLAMQTVWIILMVVTIP